MAVDVELGVGGPLGVFFEVLADVFVFEDVEGFVDDIAVLVEDVDDLSGEATLGEKAVAFHEDHDWFFGDQCVEWVVGVGLGLLGGLGFVVEVAGFGVGF